MKGKLFYLVILVLFFFSSCKPEFIPIDFGHDACEHCKMTIIDKRYATEIITSKGKAYKFDDWECLKNFSKENNLREPELLIFISNYSQSENIFLDVKKSMFLHSELFHSPMNGNYAAFASLESARSVKDSILASSSDKKIEMLNWENLKW